MALDKIFLLNLILVFHLLYTLISKSSHDLLFLLVPVVFIVRAVLQVGLMRVVGVTAAVSSVQMLMKVIAVNKSAILVLELILDLDGLVLDSLLHDHVLEDAGSHLLR